ncbi:MAG: DivIVA domain-containing protein [Atopobiaceae bacterium]|nr:DivIVA domain-containing protein [Atopobiaceae bacterium]
MAITPADIEQKTFSEAKKNGYNTDEVDEFLDQLSAEVDAMLKKIKDLKDRLTASEQQSAASQAQVAQLREQLAHATAAPAPIIQQTAPVSTGPSASEAQISRVLIVAQQSADKMLDDARSSAENIRNEADRKAREVIRQALAEKQSELDEIDRLKQSREDFRSEYKKLLQHFMDDADAVFPEQTLTSPTGSSMNYKAPAAQPAPNATVYAPAPVVQNQASLDDFDDFGDLD